MTKSFKAFRFDPELYARFKKLAGDSGLMVTEAFEKFMAACINLGRVSFPEATATLEAEARVLLAWLRQGQYWSTFDDGRKLSVEGRLLMLLSHVQDEELKRQIEEELKKPSGERP